MSAHSSSNFNGTSSQPHSSYYVNDTTNSSISSGFHASNGASSSSSAPIVHSDVWISDSVATHHMTSDLRNLTIAQPYTADNKITIGNGAGLPVVHTGSCYIKPADHVLKLNTILYVPSLAMNLLSFTKLCKDNNCFITLDESVIAMQDKASKRILYQGKSSDEGLFLFKFPHLTSSPLSHTAFVGASIPYHIWH